MKYVVDFQGFLRWPNCFVVKEAAIVTLEEEDTSPQVYYVQPPSRWNEHILQERSVNKWLEKNYHGIPWSAGTVEYIEYLNVFNVLIMLCQIPLSSM